MLASMIFVDYDNLTPEPSAHESDSEDDQPTFMAESMDLGMLGEEINVIEGKSKVARPSE